MKNAPSIFCFLLLSLAAAQRCCGQAAAGNALRYRPGFTFTLPVGDSLATTRKSGEAEVFALVGLNNLYGVINNKGQEVVPVRYEGIGQCFSGGLLAAKWGGKWGHVDKSGREVVPFKYDLVGDFSEGLAFVKRNNKFGYVNERGIEVIPVKYDEVGSFYQGLAIVELDGKKGFIDKRGTR